MLEALAEANNSAEFPQKIPTVLKIVREYREKLLAGEIPIWDLIITKHLSKNPKTVFPPVAIIKIFVGVILMILAISPNSIAVIIGWHRQD
jgi:DNA polymerase elongation subunit (family B)